MMNVDIEPHKAGIWRVLQLSIATMHHILTIVTDRGVIFFEQYLAAVQLVHIRRNFYAVVATNHGPQLKLSSTTCFILRVHTFNNINIRFRWLIILHEKMECFLEAADAAVFPCMLFHVPFLAYQVLRRLVGMKPLFQEGVFCCSAACLTLECDMLILKPM